MDIAHLGYNKNGFLHPQSVRMSMHELRDLKGLPWGLIV